MTGTGRAGARLAALARGGGAIWLVLALLLGVAMLASPAFLNPAYLLNTVRQVAPVGIAAVGVTYVMLLGGVDLSVGAVISLTAVVCAVQMDGAVANIPGAVTITLLVGAAIGAANGLLVAFNRVSPFILTLGTAIATYGLVQIYSGGTASGVVAPGFRDAFNHRLAGAVPVLALVFLGIAAAGIAIARLTVFGRRLYLIGASREAAEIAGVPVRGVTVAAYTLAGLFGSLGGIALLARSGVSSTFAGRGLEFDVLAAIVLGGTTFEGGRGGVGGTVAGVLVLVLAFNLVNVAGLDFNMQLVVKGAIVIAASALYGALRTTR